MRFPVMFVAALLLAGCNPFEEKLIGVCEDLLKERLRSPSAYKRIGVTRTEAPLTGAEYLAVQRTDPASHAGRLLLEQTASGAIKPTRISIIIEYDAPNAFNAPIRSFAKCEHVSTDGGRNAGMFDVLVDGKTKLEWLTESLRR